MTLLGEPGGNPPLGERLAHIVDRAQERVRSWPPALQRASRRESERTQQPRPTPQTGQVQPAQSVRAGQEVPADPVVRDGQGRPVGRVLSIRADHEGLSVLLRLEDPAYLAILGLREDQPPHAVQRFHVPLADLEYPSPE